MWIELQYTITCFTWTHETTYIKTKLHWEIIMGTFVEKNNQVMCMHSLRFYELLDVFSSHVKMSVIFIKQFF
jgi:hypothetical protein